MDQHGPEARRTSRAAICLVAAAAIVGLASTSAVAGTYCRTTKSATYCDDGTTFYQYGNRVQSNRGDSWTKFGSHVYGSDGSWYADHGDSVTSWFPKGETPDALESRIVPDRLFGDDEDEYED